jgi:hypothetical protein
MRDAEIDGLVDDPSGRIAIDAPAEIVAAKPDKGDLRAVRPKRASFHFPSPFYVANDREFVDAWSVRSRLPPMRLRNRKRGPCQLGLLAS